MSLENIYVKLTHKKCNYFRSCGCGLVLVQGCRVSMGSWGLVSKGSSKCSFRRILFLMISLPAKVSPLATGALICLGVDVETNEDEEK